MQNKKHIQIAVDGPSGAGKSTLSRALAAELGCVYMDTGALYRAVALYFMRANVRIDEKEKIIAGLGEIKIGLEYQNGEQLVKLNGEDVSRLIRTPDISSAASRISAIPEVRRFLLAAQRNVAAANDVIMDGRDIGTVILPDADVKIFLTATAEDRAERRYLELLSRGEQTDYATVLAAVIRRDGDDASRDVSPLKPADDAVPVDTTGNTFEQSFELLKGIITEKLRSKTNETQV